MILVRSIGMSGYISLEGVVGLSHTLSDCIFCSSSSSCWCKIKYGCKGKYRYNFDYLSGVEYAKASNYDVLRKVASFVFFKRFRNSELSSAIYDVGLLSGYYCAGVLFPRNLFHMFISRMGLRYYRDLGCVPDLPVNSYGQFLCSKAWAEYICIDRDMSQVVWPRLYIQVLDLKKPFPEFRRGGFRFLELE